MSCVKDQRYVRVYATMRDYWGVWDTQEHRVAWFSMSENAARAVSDLRGDDEALYYALSWQEEGYHTHVVR